MTKLQQYSYVCARRAAVGGRRGGWTSTCPHFVATYQRGETCRGQPGEVTELVAPGGAFYAFPRVPGGLV
jgi:hypothetical protein